MKHTFTQAQWNSLVQQFPFGTRVHGTIVHVAQFGVFVQLDEFPDVDALLEVIQMPRVELQPFQRIIYPDDYPAIGTRNEAFILGWPEKLGQIRLTQLACN
ncbi:S1 RNA-binding domain-containing protein [Hymenobacter metallilatus]|uniref:S1 RNA-binding domain-containing protein n=1 Tax=Hymenobacter metallilatus TaxID=2493666 RepID=A0A3R9MN22_9BACT|nr:S1 RNA-binding domain-containing protein [Hymenobacter metallilatus]RSK36070.1 S1 RNA-binding domain-containing protein [Hymenobacter metallilatus]